MTCTPFYDRDPVQAPPSNIGSPSGSASACKVFFRLASFADARCEELIVQRNTPEYKTYGKIIEVGACLRALPFSAYSLS